MAVTAAGTVESTRRRYVPRVRVGRIVGFVLIVVAILVLWEAVKAIGGDPWRIETDFAGIPISFFHDPPLSWRFASDQGLPHVWEVFGTMTRPIQPNGPLLASILLDSTIFTMRGALLGFILGTTFGLALAIVLVHIKFLERALVPYVVMSQTIPIIAIAPVLVIGLRAGDMSVALVAAYLTFFPVTIAALRGLRAADPRAFELMRSLAAGKRSVLWKLRLPASAPYLFTAFKVAATASVVGAIVGELPAGLREGLGGALLNFNQYYTIAPERLWATLLFAAAAGILAFGIVVIIERVALRGYRPAQEMA